MNNISRCIMHDIRGNKTQRWGTTFHYFAWSMGHALLTSIHILGCIHHTCHVYNNNYDTRQAQKTMMVPQSKDIRYCMACEALATLGWFQFFLEPTYGNVGRTQYWNNLHDLFDMLLRCVKKLGITCFFPSPSKLTLAYQGTASFAV